METSAGYKDISPLDGVAQGNGPPGPAHLDPIPEEKVIRKEMVSGNVPTGRTCSSFQASAQLLQRPGKAQPLAVSPFIYQQLSQLPCPRATSASGILSVAQPNSFLCTSPDSFCTPSPFILRRLHPSRGVAEWLG